MSETVISNAISEETGEYFTQSVKCDDEVTFLFDDVKELYVSRNFLCYASPVFDAMFKSDFKEKKSGVVKMKEKSYEDVLELLLTLHPGVQKQITDENVYIIISLAEEYQIKPTTRMCKDVLTKKLQDEYKKVTTTERPLTAEIDRTVAATACLKVLSTAVLNGYAELQEDAAEAIARFGSIVYLKEVYVFEDEEVSGAFGVGVDDWGYDENELKCLVTQRKECRQSFDALPDCVKVQLLRKRLDKTDKGKPK